MLLIHVGAIRPKVYYLLFKKFKLKQNKEWYFLWHGEGSLVSSSTFHFSFRFRIQLRRQFSFNSAQCMLKKAVGHMILHSLSYKFGCKILTNTECPQNMSADNILNIGRVLDAEWEKFKMARSEQVPLAHHIYTVPVNQ